MKNIGAYLPNNEADIYKAVFGIAFKRLSLCSDFASAVRIGHRLLLSVVSFF